MQDHAVEPVTQLHDLAALCFIDIGHFGNLHGQDHHTFVQHLVVLDVVQQRRWRATGSGIHENCRAGHALRAVACRLGKDVERQADLGHSGTHQLAALCPRRQQGEGERTDQQGEPAACRHLGQVCGEIGTVHDQEQQHDRRSDPPFPFPHADEKHRHKQGVDRHGSRHRNAISSGEVRGVAECQHEQDDRDHQRPVDHRDIDLPVVFIAGVADGQAWNEAQLDRLVGDGERARNHRLTGNEGGGRGQQHQRQTQIIRRKVEEWAQDRFLRRGISQPQDHRPLTEIIEQQARHDEAEPAHPHRPAAEMAHIGIKRFRTRHRQHHRTQRQEGEDLVRDEELDGVPRVERAQDFGRLDDLDRAQHCDDGEIDDHHRREQRAHLCGTALLQEEQEHQQADGDRDDQRLHILLNDRQAFHRGQYGYGRRDHAVPVEQTGREHAEQYCQPAVFRLPDMAGNQRHKGQRTALPAIVRAHQDGNILDRDDQRHRPEDQADNAQDMQIVQRQRVRTAEGLAKGVKRAGTDIAEDDTDGPDRQFRPGGKRLRSVCGCAHRDLRPLIRPSGARKRGA